MGSLRLSDWIVSIYVLCFSVGALSHGFDFLTYGIRPYRSAPLFFELFWSSLLIVDVLVVLLLLSKRRRVGLIFALIVMLADVSINTYASFVLVGVEVWRIVLQAIFLGFILGSIGFLFRTSRKDTLDALV